jgi:hypothetical protein
VKSSIGGDKQMKKYAGIMKLMQQVSTDADIEYMALIRFIAGKNLSSYMMLQKVAFWFERAARNDGMIYKTNQELADEIGVSLSTLKRAKNRLRGIGLDWKVQKANGNPTTHFFINFELLAKAIGKIVGDKIKDVKEYVLNFFNQNKSKEKKFTPEVDQTKSSNMNQTIGSNVTLTKGSQVNQTKGSQVDFSIGSHVNQTNNTTNQQDLQTKQTNKTDQQNHHHPEEISFKKESDPQEKDLEIDDGGKESYQLLRKFKISKKKAHELSKFSVRDIELAVKEVKSMDDVKSFAGMLVSVIESGSYKQPEMQVDEEEEPAYKRYVTGEWADFIES